MDNFQKLNLPEYNGHLLYEQTKNLANLNIHWQSDHGQICLNTIPGHENDHIYGCGSLFYDWDRVEHIEQPNGEIKMHVPERGYKPSESEFTVFNEKFKNTVFEEIYNILTAHYKVGRVRLMQSKPKTCLSWHTDSSPRIHLPIKTNPGCQMVIENQVQHMPAGTWWLTNTLLPHTAFNASTESRIHLVAVILDGAD